MRTLAGLVVGFVLGLVCARWVRIEVEVPWDVRAAPPAARPGRGGP